MYSILLCTFVIALSEAKQMYVDSPPKFTSIMVEKSPGCITESGADSGILQRLLKFQFDNNEPSKKFYFCLFKEAGLSDDAGHFYVDKVLELYQYSDQKDEIAEVTAQCNEIVAEDPFETIYEFMQCFYVKSPELLNFKTE